MYKLLSIEALVGHFPPLSATEVICQRARGGAMLTAISQGFQGRILHEIGRWTRLPVHPMSRRGESATTAPP